MPASRPCGFDSLPAWGTAAAAVLAAALVLPAGAAGQVGAPSGAQESSRRGWIGVGLDEPSCRGAPAADPRRSEEEGCGEGMVVGFVVMGAPADRAGVSPGDTVLAVDGEPLRRGDDEPTIPEFTPGQEARVLLGRAGGRTTVTVTPEPWPRNPGRLTVRVRPRQPRRPGEAGVPPEAARPTTPRVETLPPPLLHEALERRARSLRRLTVRLPDGSVVRIDDRTLKALAEGGEDAPLPSELAAFRDSVLTLARAQLDSLRQAALRDRERRQRALTSEAGDGRSVRRMAGAEFQPLTDELSEYFQGAGQGLLVLRVLSDTPASRLGLRPGDVLVGAGGREVARPGDLQEAFERYPEADSLVVKWIRKGQEMTGVLRRHRTP